MGSMWGKGCDFEPFIGWMSRRVTRGQCHQPRRVAYTVSSSSGALALMGEGRSRMTVGLCPFVVCHGKGCRELRRNGGIPKCCPRISGGAAAVVPWGLTAVDIIDIIAT